VKGLFKKKNGRSLNRCRLMPVVDRSGGDTWQNGWRRKKDLQRKKRGRQGADCAHKAKKGKLGQDNLETI